MFAARQEAPKLLFMVMKQILIIYDLMGFLLVSHIF